MIRVGGTATCTDVTFRLHKMEAQTASLKKCFRSQCVEDQTSSELARASGEHLVEKQIRTHKKLVRVSLNGFSDKMIVKSVVH